MCRALTCGGMPDPCSQSPTPAARTALCLHSRRPRGREAVPRGGDCGAGGGGWKLGAKVRRGGIEQGVNSTLGLPFIRTSVDHGTAFDIAGKDLASPDSLIEAIRLADQFSQAKRQEQSKS